MTNLNEKHWSGAQIVDGRGATVRVFRAWKRAARHIRDHLLTLPESLGWQLLIPHLEELVDPANPDRCWELAQRLDAEGDPDHPNEQGDLLYRLYVQTIASVLRPGNQAAESVSPEGVHVSLGLQGLLVVMATSTPEPTVLTAFLPGFGSPMAVKRTDAARVRGQQANRQYDFSKAARVSAGTASNRVNVFQSERFANWSKEERIYYALFRPAAQFVRSRHVYQYQESGKTEDYARLKEPLGPLSSWSFPSWLERWSRSTAGIAEERCNDR